MKLFSEQASDAAKVAQAKIYQTQKLANQVAKQMEVSASLFTRTDEDSGKINFKAQRITKFYLGLYVDLEYSLNDVSDNATFAFYNAEERFEELIDATVGTIQKFENSRSSDEGESWFKSRFDVI